MGLLVTVPAPVPMRLTVRTGNRLNVAVTELLAFKVTVQLPVPLQAPPHPAKMEFAAGVALSVTCVPDWKDALQTCPQLIPAGLLVIVPLPVPARVTFNTGAVAGEELKVARTEVLFVNVTSQVFAPLQDPPHPAKTEFGAGVAVSVTCVPGWKVALQTCPQLIPAGLLVIVPALPARLTVS